MIRCEFCGAPLDPEEKKCPYCGTAVPKAEKASPAPSPGRTAEPPLWNTSAPPQQPYSSNRPARVTKRMPGCLVVFIISFVLISITIVLPIIKNVTSAVRQPFQQADDAFIDDNEANSDSSVYPLEYESWYKPGMYKVGVDLAAGIYRVDALDSDGYFAVYSDSSGQSSSILFNDIFETHTYLLLKEGQYLRLSRCAALQSEKVSAVQPADGVFTDGMFRVGIDIPAGEYKITGTGSSSYYQLTGTPQCAYDDRVYIASDYVENAVYQTLEDGQFLTLEDGAQLIAQVSSSFPQA